MPFNTVDFVKRCISYYEYKTPLEKRQELIISLLNNYNTFISLVNAK